MQIVRKPLILIALCAIMTGASFSLAAAQQATTGQTSGSTNQNYPCNPPQSSSSTNKPYTENPGQTQCGSSADCAPPRAGC